MFVSNFSYGNVQFCGGTSYLVGQKDHCIKVWNLGQGQEVTPPAAVTELCINYEAYYVSAKEAVMMFACEGNQNILY